MLPKMNWMRCDDSKRRRRAVPYHNNYTVNISVKTYSTNKVCVVVIWLSRNGRVRIMVLCIYISYRDVYTLIKEMPV